jgi:hypothetical protein
MDEKYKNRDDVQRHQATVLVEKIKNVAGSTSGAGSGDYHHYRKFRRRERARQYYADIAQKEVFNYSGCLFMFLENSLG